MKKRVVTLIIVLLALAFLICAPAAHGGGTLGPSGITPTPAPFDPATAEHRVYVPAVMR